MQDSSKYERTPLRAVAARILALPSDTERDAALAAIASPDARAIVRFYIDDHRARRDGTPLPDLFPPRPF